MDSVDLGERLEADGYFCLNELFDRTTSAALCKRLDYFAEEHPGRKALIPDNVFDSFVTHPLLLKYAKLLLGDRILFHHANGRAMKKAAFPKEWHHDYDGPRPWALSDPLMIHFMIYPAGLDSTNGPLMIVPGSHKRQVDRDYPSRHGLMTIEGTVELCGGPGLVVVINSALWHARKKPSQLPRYDLNFSFCQPGLTRPERESYFSVLKQLEQVVPEEREEFFRAGTT